VGCQTLNPNLEKESSKVTLVVEAVGTISPEHLADGLLSIVVFGSGTGEAIVVKLPDGKVGVVDGCRRKADADDPVQALVEKLKVDRLLFACLTHPHEDHFAGLADVVKAFDPEHLIWAGTEHQRLLEHFAKSFRDFQIASQAIADGVDPRELEMLVDEFVRRSQRKSRSRTGPRSRAQSLSDHKLLLTIPHDSETIELWGVLPTTTALHRALGKNSAAGEPPAEDQEPVLGETDANEISGAMLIRWGAASVLLAGDSLIGRANHHEGWAAADWIPAPVQIVKVAHHASSGAHSDELWDRLKPQVALVTPFRNAVGTQPPRETMLSKLCAATEILVLTARPAWWAKRSVLSARPAWDIAPPLAGTPFDCAQPASQSYGAVSVSIDKAGTVKRVVAAGAARQIQSTGSLSNPIARPTPGV